jgi:hypothetical protein
MGFARRTQMMQRWADYLDGLRAMKPKVVSIQQQAA